MRLACALTWWLIVLTFAGFSTSQEKPTTEKVSAGVAQQNLIKKVEPVYPQMDRVSIEGKVVLDVIISREGNVESIKVISGHPMLFQSAMDAVKQWTYKPFLLNGQPIEVETLIEVPFSLAANSQKLREQSQTYFKEAGKCRNAIAGNDAAAEMVCIRLTGIAEQLDPSLRWERVDAYKLAGRALAKRNKFEEALASYQDELAVAKVTELPTDFLVDAYRDVAAGFRAIGDLRQAQTHYDAAQSLLENARQAASPGEERNRYSKALRALLREYASLLREAGKTAAAAGLETKAEGIKVDPDF